MKTMSPLEHAQALRRLEGEMISANRMADEAHEVAIAAQRREAGNRKRAAELAREIQELSAVRTGAVVSEHALLRWLERVRGVDLETLRQEILGGGTEASINFAVNGSIQKSGHTLVVKDRVVVTVK